MKKPILIIYFLFITGIIFSQKRDLEREYYNIEIINIQVNELYNFPISNLKDNKIIIELKNKLKTELNTVASCVIYYKYSKTFKLSEKEKNEILRRIEKIAKKFIELEKLVLFKTSGDSAPIFGVRKKIINKKEVKIVLLGGDCSISEVKKKEEKIYSTFNKIIENEIKR